MRVECWWNFRHNAAKKPLKKTKPALVPLLLLINHPEMQHVENKNANSLFLLEPTIEPKKKRRLSVDLCGPEPLWKVLGYIPSPSSVTPAASALAQLVHRDAELGQRERVSAGESSKCVNGAKPETSNPHLRATESEKF